MKLKIKETGEVLEDVKFIDTTLHKITIQYLDNGVLRECSVKNLSDVEEVKDYEEPKEHWAIDQFGEPINVSGLSRLQLEKLHRLGNDFPSENATMKAIEKLKAWERLKDKGFKVTLRGWKGNAWLYANWGNLQGDYSDILLLFGGEE